MGKINIDEYKEIETVLFDLDGTLLPIDAKDFETTYITSITEYLDGILPPEQMAGALWQASATMIKNDEYRLNKDVFYEMFEELVGTDNLGIIESKLDDYYETGFNAVEKVTTVSLEIVAVIEYLKNKNIPIILATNPIFPEEATNKRIKWAGLSVDDFQDITRFEKNHYCKPNLSYYKEIVKDNNLDPRKCLMIGNDVEEDLLAQELGMKTWLLDDNLIHRGSAINCDWRGNRAQFLQTIKEVF